MSASRPEFNFESMPAPDSQAASSERMLSETDMSTYQQFVQSSEDMTDSANEILDKFGLTFGEEGQDDGAAGDGPENDPVEEAIPDPDGNPVQIDDLLGNPWAYENSTTGQEPAFVEEPFSEIGGTNGESIESTDVMTSFDQPESTQTNESTAVDEYLGQLSDTETAESIEVTNYSDQSSNESAEPTDSGEYSDVTHSIDYTDNAEEFLEEPEYSEHLVEPADDAQRKKEVNDFVAMYNKIGEAVFEEGPTDTEDLAQDAIIAQLVEQLADTDFNRREQASDQLREQGLDALQRLVAASTGEDPERAARALKLLKEFEDDMSDRRPGETIKVDGHDLAGRT